MNYWSTRLPEFLFHHGWGGEIVSVNSDDIKIGQYDHGGPFQMLLNGALNGNR